MNIIFINESYSQEIINEIKSSKKKKRKYPCKYCGELFTKDDMGEHIENVHPDLIPQGYTAKRLAFNNIYNKDHGKCIICGSNTEWNEENNTYNRLCNKPSCRKQFTLNMQKASYDKYGKKTLLNDVEHQKKMLANRGISGKYSFQDGTERTYTGSYEKNFLEFMDTVLNVPAEDIITPGPTFEYEFNGETHKFITDAYYIPYNLVFDIKDGGDNKNTHPGMQINRDKQKAKEDAVAKAKTHNYIRLTNNDFSQLLYIFAELKASMYNSSKDGIEVNPIIHINESMIPKKSDDRFIICEKSNAGILEYSFTKNINEINGNLIKVFKVKEDAMNVNNLQYEDLEALLYDDRVEDITEDVSYLIKSSFSIDLNKFNEESKLDIRNIAFNEESAKIHNKDKWFSTDDPFIFVIDNPDDPISIGKKLSKLYSAMYINLDEAIENEYGKGYTNSVAKEDALQLCMSFIEENNNQDKFIFEFSNLNFFSNINNFMEESTIVCNKDLLKGEE